MSQLTLGAEWGVFKDADIGSAALRQNNLDGDDYARYTPTTVKHLTSTPVTGVALPDDAAHAIIFILNNAVSFRIGGTDATAGEGGVLPQDYVLFLPNARATLEAISFIDTAAGASEVRVVYGRAV